jgi:Tol biopolymer transport system component
VRSDGTRARLLIRRTGGAAPAWSADGLKLVFMDPAGLMTANGRGSGLHRLTHRRGDSQPSWSPDGTRVVFTDSQSDVVVIGADGKRRRKLTTTGQELLPAWSPDGTKILYSGQDHCRPPEDETCPHQLYLMDANGSHKRRLTFTSDSAIGGAWSPDGSRILFTLRQGGSGGDALAVMPVSGARPTRLTQYRSFYLPAWSPDGKRIVFEQGDDLEPAITHLWMSLPDGTRQRRLTHSAGEGNPDWQPRPG